MKKITNEYITGILDAIPDDKEGMYKKEVVKDYWTCCVSREVSILGRKEVLTGKAKFGILGDGKELPQTVMSRFFEEGDWRSGYYRDQTFMFSAGLSSVKEFFAQLYADSDNDPYSKGRQMNGHFATPTVDENGDFLALADLKNISSDISPTAGQMARGLGLAVASKIFRKNEQWKDETQLSRNGREIVFVTIGDASTSEGVFWETLNAAAVNNVPMCVIVWDDGYGISVPRERQTVKDSISKALGGFEKDGDATGINIYNVKAWDYPKLNTIFAEATEQSRTHHTPCLIHVEDVTQPQGHSTSGSHERYKSKERLEWEKENDCILKFEHWIVDQDVLSEELMKDIREEAIKYARAEKREAWNSYMDPIKKYKHEVFFTLEAQGSPRALETKKEIESMMNPLMAEIHAEVVRLYQRLIHEGQDVSMIEELIDGGRRLADERYHTNLYSHTPKSALQVPVVPAIYEDDTTVNGYQLLNAFFDKKLAENKAISAFGEDVGEIGDVNQGFAGLQEKYGVERVFDSGIREWSIMGTAIGMSMRGLRPIAEIQYLDYLIYGLSPLSDDLSTLRYRTGGIQAAPAIIRTRGHRLEGIWHAGSPIGMILNSLKGMYVCVPRDMTQAAGFYNTMLQSDDPALIIECLNGYRLKERLPSNIGAYTVPLGVPEILVEGSDVTLVTYGSCVRIAKEAVAILAEVGISVELIDVQTLMPFDLEHGILDSIKKTSRVVFLDEDVPGGGTAYMMQKVLDEQGAYRYLDAAPRAISAWAHRPPFGSDGDYFSKPNTEDIYTIIYNIMHEAFPDKYSRIG